MSIELIDAPAGHVWVKHLKRSAAGIDPIVMGEIGEPFEDAEQLRVPGSPQDPTTVKPLSARTR